jgi:hypothetical protein
VIRRGAVWPSSIWPCSSVRPARQLVQPSISRLQASSRVLAGYESPRRICSLTDLPRPSSPGDKACPATFAARHSRAVADLLTDPPDRPKVAGNAGDLRSALSALFGDPRRAQNPRRAHARRPIRRAKAGRPGRNPPPTYIVVCPGATISHAFLECGDLSPLSSLWTVLTLEGGKRNPKR